MTTTIKAKIMVKGDREDSYADVCAAISEEYPEIDEFIFCFEDETNFVELDEKIPRLLTKISEEQEATSYTKAFKKKFSTEVVPKGELQRLQDAKIVDITCVDKVTAMNIATSNLQMGFKYKICLLKWTEKLEQNSETKKILRVGKNDYEYTDLLSIGAMAEFKKNNRARRIYLFSYSVTLILLCIIVLLQIIFNIEIPDNLANTLSFAMAIGGFIVSYMSLER